MIKSQDDLNQDDRVGRTMTLLKAIEQLEKTEVELEKVEKKLKIAIKYLKRICNDYSCSTCMSCISSAFAKTALYEIKELDK